jgi:hypothetical protein
MAYDSGYERAPSSDQYPTQYSHDERDSQPYDSPPSSYHPPPSQNQYPTELGGRRRSRASSQAPSDISQLSQTYPMLDTANAVNTAFNRSDAAAQVDPALIAQITKQVIESLKESGITGAGAKKQQQQQQQEQPQQQQPVRAPQPLPTGGVFPQRNVYTPPSPSRHDFPSRDSNSPEMFSQERELSQESVGDTPTPKFGEKVKLNRTMSMSSSVPGESPTRQRPAPTPREPSDNEATTLEKIWQPLFDPEGIPTSRLSQFLRGLANHIVGAITRPDTSVHLLNHFLSRSMTMNQKRASLSPQPKCLNFTKR